MTKECSECGVRKPIIDFPSKGSGGQHNKCKPCYNSYNRSVYATSEKTVRRSINNRNKQKIKDRFIGWKTQQVCRCCMESTAICLDLHHTNPAEKDDTVSRLVNNGVSWERIVEEIDKCVVVCSNCHRKIHAGHITL